MNAAEAFARIVSEIEGHWREGGTTYRCRCPCPDHEDKNPSCDIKLSGDKLLVTCQSRHCPQEDIIRALKDRDFWPTADTYSKTTPYKSKPRPHTPPKKVTRPPGIPQKRETKDKKTGKISDTKFFVDFWTYKDKAGKVLGHAVRYENAGKKDVVPFFHKNQQGNWYGGFPETPRPLYGLNHLTRAPEDLTIWIVEGEKCAEALQQVHRLATTSMGGGKAVELTDWSPLAGRKIRIWPDNDKPGQEYVGRIRIQLEALMPPPTIEIIDVSKLGLEETGDVFDWLQIHEPDELSEIPLEGKKGLKKTSLKGLLETDFKPEELILAPWLPTQGLCMVHARPGVGKTFLAIGIAFAVAAGSKFLKWEAPKARGVLYVDGEMAGNDIKKRYEKIVVEHGFTLPSKPLEIITPDINEDLLPDIGTKAGQELIESQLTDEIELLILDNISCLQRTGVENEAGGWTLMQEWLLHLKSIGKAVFLIHHSGKGGSQRGTSKREDFLNTILTLKRNPAYEFEEGARFEIHYEKARSVYGAAARPFEAQLDIVEGVWTMKDLKVVTYEQVVRMMKDGYQQVDIAQTLEKSKGLISKYVKRAKEKGDL
jgi:hypothetical protein